MCCATKPWALTQEEHFQHPLCCFNFELGQRSPPAGVQCCLLVRQEKYQSWFHSISQKTLWASLQAIAPRERRSWYTQWSQTSSWQVAPSESLSAAQVMGVQSLGGAWHVAGSPTLWSVGWWLWVMVMLDTCPQLREKMRSGQVSCAGFLAPW